MKLDAELAGVLSYLRDLGWTDLYREPPGRDPSSGEAPAREAESAEAVEVSSQPGQQVGDRASRLALVEQQALSCTACKLAQGRNKVVFGTGKPDADLMFIGEGPGAQEDRQGLPFVGPAGELLTKIIAAIGLRREDVYIANMVKCRPPGNRDPEVDEVTACRPFLEQQIDLVAPKVIVALGRVAAQTLLETDRSLGKMRGEWFVVAGVETRVTYHPAALLRNASYKRPLWDDMQLVRDRLKELA